MTSPSSTSARRSVGSSATRSPRTGRCAIRFRPKPMRSQSSEFSFGSAERIGNREELEAATAGADAVFLGVGLGRGHRYLVPGRRPSRSLGVARLHRGAQDRAAAQVGPRVVVDRRRQYRHRRRTRGDPARRGRGHDPLPPHRGGDAGLHARDPGGARRRRSLPVPGDPGRVPGLGGPGRNQVPGDGARRARRERPATACARRGLRLHAARRHGREGDRPAGRARSFPAGSTVSSSCTARSRSTRPEAPDTTMFFAGGDAINGGASVVEAVRDGKRAAEEIDRELRWRS